MYCAGIVRRAGDRGCRVGALDALGAIGTPPVSINEDAAGSSVEIEMRPKLETSTSKLGEEMPPGDGCVDGACDPKRAKGVERTDTTSSISGSTHGTGMMRFLRSLLPRVSKHIPAVRSSADHDGEPSSLAARGVCARSDERGEGSRGHVR